MDRSRLLRRVGHQLQKVKLTQTSAIGPGSERHMAYFATAFGMNRLRETQNSQYRSSNTIRHYSLPYKPKLERVGIFETPKVEGRYVTGQLFLHKVFGYRGVILFPWSAQLYERDKDEADKTREAEDGSSGKQVIARTLTYYQVLVDSRDCPHINAQSESVTFLGNTERGQSLYTIPGLDYVSQDDILPYTTVEKIPIHHDLFHKFLTYDPTSGKLPQPTETLISWQDKNHMCLELSKVHQETTGDIRITAMPFFLGAKETQNMQEYWWRYCIRIENLGECSARLRERHWRIISNGSVKTVRGRGVIGREPVLTKEQPAFQYSSHVSLHSPTGHMWGMFRMERPDGTQFDVRIPAYALESKLDEAPGSNPNGFHDS